MIRINLATIGILSLLISSVYSHVYLTQPLTEFKNGVSKSSWVDETGPPWEGGNYKTGAAFAADARNHGVDPKNMRQFLENRGPVCGNSLPDATPKPIPSDGIVKFASTIEHPGPCEFWLDDTLAFQNEDCEKHFNGALEFKMDFSACGDGCMLRFYWLGLQDSGERWQTYKNCIPLDNGPKNNSPNESPPQIISSPAPTETKVEENPLTNLPAPEPSPEEEVAKVPNYPTHCLRRVRRLRQAL